MICVTISQESRRLALADMLNAGGRADLLEMRLDRFGKAPEIGEILAAKPKPIIMTCRRTQDGGHWDGAEEDRVAMLRQCIISKADYVEIELDIADQVRKPPESLKLPTKRIISYTNTNETPKDISRIYAQCQTKQPDFIKLTTKFQTVEEAWPLIQILAKPTVPTVVLGLGRPGVLLTVLGKKLGSPWTYAALEKGMEAFDGQPTIDQLESTFHFAAIDRNTRFIGVTGFGELEFVTIAALNAVFAHMGLPARCLPVPMGKLAPFQKVLDAAKLSAVIVDAQHRGPGLEITAEPEEPAKSAESVDVIVRKDDKWAGYNTLWRAAVGSLEAVLKAKGGSEKPLEGRMIMIVGANALARTMAYGVKKRGGVPIVASRDPGGAQLVAQMFQCRHIQFEAMYSTMHDILCVCSEEREKLKDKARSGEAGVHGGYLKPGMTVMDLANMPHKSSLVKEAGPRGCNVVEPRQILQAQLELQVRLITGKEPPRDVIQQALAAAIGDE